MEQSLTLQRVPATPVLRGGLLLGVLRDFQKDPLGLLERAAALGPVVRCRIGPRTGHIIVGPDEVQEALVNQARAFAKRGQSYTYLRESLGQGLVTAEGDLWKRQRALIQPAFHRQRVLALGHMMVARTRALADRWAGSPEQQALRDVHRDMMALTLTIVAEALFASNVAPHTERIGHALDVTVEWVFEASNRLIPIPRWVPTRANRRFNEAMRTLDDVVAELIDERARPQQRAGGEHSNDLLSMLMEARDEHGAPMSRAQLRDEVMTLLLAGHETTANALSWTLYLLAQHPDVERALLVELDANLGTRDVTTDDLPALDLLDRVLKESMRLYPPVWGVEREVVADVDLCGHRLRRGDFAILSAWATHRVPALWPEPRRFDPDRFLAAAQAGRHRLAYFPFLFGARKCIGDLFAQVEAKLVLATLLRRYTFTLDARRPVQPRALVTLRPESGLWMRVDARSHQRS